METGTDEEACGMLNALECFRMVDRITRSNSIRNTLCCCFYYLCLFLLVSCCCFLLSEVATGKDVGAKVKSTTEEVGSRGMESE